MKRYAIVLCGLLFMGGISAQPLAGHIYLGGGFSFMSSQYEIQQNGNVTTSTEMSQFSLRPAVGYTFSDHFLAGLRLDLVNNSTNGADDADFGAQLFARYYIPAAERFLFFPEFMLGFANDEIYRRTPGGWPVEPTQFMVGLSPGFAFYPTTHWGIELSVGFLGFTTSSGTNTIPDPDQEISGSTFDFSLNGSNVSVGVSYLIQVKE